MIETMLLKKSKAFGPVDATEYQKLLTWLANTTTGKLYLGRSLNSLASATGTGAAKSKVVMGEVTGVMYGSPYKGVQFYSGSSVLGRVAQHAFPSKEIFQFNVDNKLTIAMNNIGFNGSTTVMTALDRNGYLSLAAASLPYYVTDTLIYYDPSTSKIMQYNPRSNTTPVEFTFPA